MPTFFAVVFGGGLAGLSVARRLTDAGKSVLIVEPRISDPQISQPTPGPPAALVNPATGRHARLSWESEACYNSLLEWLAYLQNAMGNAPDSHPGNTRLNPGHISAKWNSETASLRQKGSPPANESVNTSHGAEGALFTRGGIVRPALTPELAENFKASLAGYPWPEGWAKWLDAGEIRDMNPQIAPCHGGLHIPVGVTVFVDRYLDACRKELLRRGAVFTNRPCMYLADEAGSGFRIVFKVSQPPEEHPGGGDAEYRAGHVIVAAGYGTRQFSDWDYLGLHYVKGQVNEYRLSEPPGWDHAVSAMGYVLQRGGQTLVCGSTYEHRFSDLETTEASIRQNHNKLKRMLPGIAEKAEFLRAMAGVRVTTPNKLPVIGPHRQNPNLHIYSGLGSKGLLFSEYVASILGNHLIHGSEIPHELGTARFAEN